MQSSSPQITEIKIYTGSDKKELNESFKLD